MYSIKITTDPNRTYEQEISTDENCGPDGCDFCPVGECISNCAWNEYFLNQQAECEVCDDECTSGCVRAENCSPCADLECKICDCYGEDAECLECIEFAAKDENGDCQCQDGSLYLIETHECGECHPSCAKCFGPSNLECTECKDGFFLQYNISAYTNICEDTCPTGSIPSGTTCLPPAETDIACFTFDRQTYLTEVNGITLTHQFLGTADCVADTLKTYNNRGIWFDQCHYFEITGLILPTSFTIQVWFRATTAGSLFEVNRNEITGIDSENFINFNIIPRSLQFIFSEASSELANVSGSDNFLMEAWNHSHIIVWFNDGNTSIFIFANKNFVGTGAFSVPIVDQPEYTKLLGAEPNVNAQ